MFSTNQKYQKTFSKCQTQLLLGLKNLTMDYLLNWIMFKRLLGICRSIIEKCAHPPDKEEINEGKLQ